MKIDWKRKLSSRKLWVSIAGLTSGLILTFGGSEAAASTVAGVILQIASVLGYLLAEGLTDVAHMEDEYEQRSQFDSPEAPEDHQDSDQTV